MSADGAQPQLRLEQMFEEYAGQIYAYARHRVDPDAADDVVADTFLAAWRRIEDVPKEPLAWLFTTARNNIANELRRRARYSALTQRLTVTAAQVSNAVAEDDATYEARQQVATALQSLSEQDQEILVLSAWCDLTNRQAAGVLGCRPETYAVRLHRARRRLQKHLPPVPSRQAAQTRPHEAGGSS